ncbi:MAG TPA: cysteine synthase family protein [Victivallales bacterium]|nr:cysteine synthase family protein [Victivallales bacterium]
MKNKPCCDRINGLASLIGNTPLLEISFEYKGSQRKIYAKAENLNMTGSIKDRMAFHILKQGYIRGNLNPGDLVIEATSGNTGIAFSAIAKALGHPVTIFMPDWMSTERKNLIQSLGADIVLISKEEGGFKGSIERAEELAKANKNSFLPRQFSNEDNIQAHFETTGPEIWWQIRYRNLIPDALVAGVGTGGTIMGVGRYLKEKNPDMKLYPLEPSNSPTLTTGYKVGKHRIQGISDEFIPPIVHLDELDHVISVYDGDSIIMARKLAAELGLGVGISSGANFLGALIAQEELGTDKTIVTVFPDDNKKYLSTDLLRHEPVKDGFLSTDIKLLSVKAFKRVCDTCCDPDICLNGCSDDSEVHKVDDTQIPECPRRK